MRHTDRSDSSPQRRVTALYYLNPDWDEGEMGGQLRLYLRGGGRGGEGERGEGGGRGRAEEGREEEDGARCSEGRHCMAESQSDVTSGGVQMQQQQQQQQGGLSGGCHHRDVSPVLDRLVLFRSDTWHEVLPCHACRYALTCWFCEEDEAEGRSREVERGGGERGEVENVRGEGSGEESNGMTDGMGPAMGVESRRWETRASELPSSAVLADNEQLQRSMQGSQAAREEEGGGGREADRAKAGRGRGTVQAVEQQQGTGDAERRDRGGGEIFVSVVCFRDSECMWTMRSLLSNADRPEALRIGVVWQVSGRGR